MERIFSRTSRLLAAAALLTLFFPASARAQTSAKSVRTDLSEDKAIPDGPRFRGGDMRAFRRWVMTQLDFPADYYTAGERIRLVVRFDLTKGGRAKNATVNDPSDDPIVNKVLAAVEKSDGWTLGSTSGRVPGAKYSLALDILLRENPDGTLRADDHFVYTRADTMPRFEGGGPRAFRSWIERHVTLHMPGADGTVVGRFVVEKDGSMSELTVHVTEGEKALKGRVKEACAAAPRWTPAVAQGERVRIGCSMKFLFGRAAAEAAADSTANNGEEAYLLTETMPRFNGGGLDAFRVWVQNNLSYPTEALVHGKKGRVLLTFIIEKDGSVGNIKVLESPDDDLAKAAVQTVSRSPKWTPGEQDGHVVRVIFTLPIDFTFKETPAVQYRFRPGTRP